MMASSAIEKIVEESEIGRCFFRAAAKDVVGASWASRDVRSPGVSGLDMLNLSSSGRNPQQTCASGLGGATDQDAEAVADGGVE